MPNYRYSGRLMDGRHVQGDMRAADQTDLEFRLINRGVSLESFKPVHSRWRLTLTRLLQRSEITRMTRQTGILLKSDISMLETLELVKAQISDYVLVQIMVSVIRDVESGKSVASALAEFPIIFDRLYVSLVEAGELSGDLDTAFDRIATYREKYEATTQKVKSAIAYPLLVVFVAILVALALILYIVPVFSSMYENFGAALPPLTRTVVTVSTFLRDTIWFWLVCVLIMSAVLVYTGSTKKARYTLHLLLLRLPIAKSLSVKIISTRFCRTMGALLTSGVEIIRALQTSSGTTGNHYADSLLQSAALRLAEGKSFTEAVAAASVFPGAMLKLTASGERTGRLGEMLERAADYYEKEVELDLGTLTSLIEPVIIILLGVFVAFILIAMYLPLFELAGTI
jgi:type IV pilus assembly protein PilC